jgi:hypothetical protein
MKLLSGLRSTIAVLVLLALAGCTTIMVWTGLRIRLEKTPIASIHAEIQQGPAMYPGQTAPLVVSVVEPNGNVDRTEGAGKGVVLWEDLAVSGNIATVDSKGIVTMPADPAVSDGKIPHLVIIVPSHPDMRTELNVPLRYDVAFTADFSGRSGRPGTDGMDGSAGIDGAPGSTDEKNPSPGGDGTDGGDGWDGGDGGDGEDARPAYVQVALHPGVHPLLQVSVFNGIKTEHFLVDPQGGTLTINVEGGRGGAGGRGGKGGRGGVGGIGSPNGISGNNGRDGRDGRDGKPGKPGPITVIFDPQTQTYLPAIIFLNRYGSKKVGPFPTFREETVAPLW